VGHYGYVGMVLLNGLSPLFAARVRVQDAHRGVRPSLKVSGSQSSGMLSSAAPSPMELRRLCDDIQSLGPCVHTDILKHVDPSILTRNGNGVFFDMADLGPQQLANIREVVAYAKGTRARLAEHDKEMFKSAQRLVMGPVETGADSEVGAGAPASCAAGPSEGEEAFCTRMEAGCVAKPAKGVFLKK